MDSSVLICVEEGMYRLDHARAYLRITATRLIFQIKYKLVILRKTKAVLALFEFLE